eukprot:gene9676-8501_t
MLIRHQPTRFPAKPFGYDAADDSMFETVSCGGIDRLGSGVTIAGFSVTQDDNGYDARYYSRYTSLAIELTSIICWFSDNTQKMLGSPGFRDIAETGPPTNDSMVQSPGDCYFDMSESPVDKIFMTTSKFHSDRLCFSVIALANGEQSDGDKRKCGYNAAVCYYDEAPTQSTTLVYGNVMLADIMALVMKQTGKVVALSWGTTPSFDSAEITSMEFKDLQTQPGPFPSYNLGIVMDNQLCSFGGSMTTTLAYTTTLSATASIANTTGKSFSKAFKATGTVASIKLPEYSTEKTWTNSTTVTSSQTFTRSATISITPTVNVLSGKQNTLNNFLYNGTAQLPYTASVTLTVGEKKLTAQLPCTASVMLTVGEKKTADTKDTPLDFVPVPKPTIPLKGYPFSQPLVYSTPRVTKASAANLSVCGSMMQRGGLATITGYMIPNPSNPDRYAPYWTGLKLSTHSGEEVMCGSSDGHTEVDQWWNRVGVGPDGIVLW